jgi:hypothetical protein
VEPTQTHLNTISATEKEKEKSPGDAENTKATGGVLCLYVTFSVNNPTLSLAGAGKDGAFLLFGKIDEAIGSWAFKAS